MEWERREGKLNRYTQRSKRLRGSTGNRDCAIMSGILSSAKNALTLSLAGPTSCPRCVRFSSLGSSLQGGAWSGDEQ